MTSDSPTTSWSNSVPNCPGAMPSGNPVQASNESVQGTFSAIQLVARQ